MFVVFGTRMVGAQDPASRSAVCEHCGKHATLRSYTGRRFFTLYLIPLIPLGRSTRVIDECRSCKQGKHIPVEQMSVLLEAAKPSMQACLEAVKRGEKDFIDPADDSEAQTGPYIASSVGALMDFGCQEDAKELMRVLRELGARYEAAFARAALCFRRAAYDQAIEAIDEARAAHPDDIYAPYFAGCALAEARRIDEALGYLEPLHQKHPEDVGLMTELASAYEQGGMWAEAARTCAQIIRVVPEIRDDKHFMKAARKICKKAGRDLESLVAA